MTAPSHQRLSPGQALFTQYAYPPNELGYCGPTGAGRPDGDRTSQLATHAREFDGAWPYLAAVADAVGNSDPLDEDVVRSYWVGGPSLDKVDPAVLVAQLRTAFVGQVTGLLDQLASADGALAHHSFHVFVVYPWVRFLQRDAVPSVPLPFGREVPPLRASGPPRKAGGTPTSTTALHVMQACRIRWGHVVSVTGDEAVIASPPLRFDAGTLTLGEPETERVWWRKDGVSLAPAPQPGTVVSAHWEWVCGTLADDESAALAAATQATLDLVNAARGAHTPIYGASGRGVRV